jgi:hypothetical protein
MKPHLSQQIEQIIDEGKGPRRSVIVRMAAPDKARRDLLRAASHAIQKRNLTLTARDLLPASAKTLRRPRSGKRKAAARRELRAHEGSLAAAVATIAVSSIVEVTPVVGPLFRALRASPAARKAVSDMFAGTKRGRTKRVPQAPEFPTSKSAVLEMSKDDLRKLPEEVPNIEGIYPNRTLRIPRIVETRNLPQNVRENKAASWGVHAIGALAAWGAYDNARGQGVKVGLLDTGVAAQHPDLASKVQDWAEFDAQGRPVPNSRPHDSDQHGTHCAGTIVGGNASGQWIGAAPQAKLAAALVLDGENGGTDAQVLAGIEWAVQQKVDVISMSLGGLTIGPEVPDYYTEAIISCLRTGIPVVAAIGNEGHQTSSAPGNDLFAFSVGATDHLDRSAGFSGGRTQVIRESNFIPPESLPLPYSKPEISAPGVAVFSSIPGDKWAAFNGTSMATPHVAGAIALLLSAKSIRHDVTGVERAFLLQDLLTSSVEELGEAGQDHRFGFGRLDVLRAIGFAHEQDY